VVHARDDTLHPALEIPRDIGDRLARTERCGRLRVVQENDRAAHALDADLEGDARAKRGLLKNERDELTAQRGSVAAGTAFTSAES